MPTWMSAWLDTPQGASALFGFSAICLFAVWRKAALRWSSWHPIILRMARWTLYAVTAYVVFLGLRALGTGFDLGGLLLSLVVPGAVFAPKLFMKKEKIRRGARVGTVKEVNDHTAKAQSRADLKDAFDIGGVTIPRTAEPYHFLVVGSTGTGKSVAIAGLLDKIEARGDIALVVDSGGGFTSRYYQAKRDVVLNPFDDRCVPWSPTAELEGPWDAEALARSMIPDGVGDSKEWNGYAQTFVTSLLRRLHEKGELSAQRFLYLAQAAPVEELQTLLQGTPAAAQLGADRTFGSIRTIATSYLATYSYLQGGDQAFSVAKWLQKGKPGFLFLTYRDDQLDSLRNLIACVLDIAARTILSLPEHKSRRIWLIIDEFASIGKVQSIEAVATKARKMGGCLLIGLQSVSQLKDRYGDNAAQTILSCLSSWLVLRCADTETAEYMSKYIGESEIKRMTEGESSSIQGGSSSLNEQIQMQRAILPAQIQQLPNLVGFFKLAGNAPTCQVKLRFPKKRAEQQPGYALRDFKAKPMLDLMPAASSTEADQADSQGRREPVMAEQPVAPVAPAVSATGVEGAKPAEATAAAVLKVLPRNALNAGPAALMSVLDELMADEFEDEED